MTFFRSTMMAAAAVSILALGYAMPTQAQDAATAVKERVALMKGMGGANAAIGKAASAADAVGPAKTILANVGKLEGLWPANSITADSRAKPEIWQNMNDFKAQLGKLKAAATQMVAAAEKGDLDAVKAAQKEGAGACGGCHRTFRGPEK